MLHKKGPGDRGKNGRRGWRRWRPSCLTPPEHNGLTAVDTIRAGDLREGRCIRATLSRVALACLCTVPTPFARAAAITLVLAREYLFFRGARAAALNKAFER